MASASHAFSTLPFTAPSTNQRINNRVAGDGTYESFVIPNILGSPFTVQGGVLIATKASYPGSGLWYPLRGYPPVKYWLGLGGKTLQPGRVLSQSILSPRTIAGLTSIPATFGGIKKIVCCGHSAFRSHMGGSDEINESGSSLRAGVEIAYGY